MKRSCLSKALEALGAVRRGPVDVSLCDTRHAASLQRERSKSRLRFAERNVYKIAFATPT
jgi:hypothetical protein